MRASWITPGGSDASSCLISEIASTGLGSRLLVSEPDSGERLFAGRVSDPLFTPQIAACVRLWTRILRRIALMWTFTVASAISIFRAMHLLESPSIRQRRIDISRGESCGANASPVVTRIAWLLSSHGTRGRRLRNRERMTEPAGKLFHPSSAIPST